MNARIRRGGMINAGRKRRGRRSRPDRPRRITAATRMVLANAIYFKEPGVLVRQGGLTRTMMRSRADNTKVDVPLSTGISEFSYGQALRPYRRFGTEMSSPAGNNRARPPDATASGHDPVPHGQASHADQAEDAAVRRPPALGEPILSTNAHGRQGMKQAFGD